MIARSTTVRTRHRIRLARVDRVVTCTPCRATRPEEDEDHATMVRRRDRSLIAASRIHLAYFKCYAPALTGPAAIGVPAAVQDHRVVRERAGRADRGPPVVRVGFQALEQGRRLALGSDGQRLQGLAQGADRVLAEPVPPAVLDGTQALEVEALRERPPRGEAGHLAAARGGVGLLGRQAGPEQDA